MICNFTHFSIALLWFLPVFSSAQTEPMDLSLEQSLTLLRSENKSLRIAGKEVELAKNEHQKLNAFWYPTISAAGAYVHMSNPVEVHQSLNQFTDPAKEYVHSILPNDQFISSLLDKIGQNTLTLPLISQNVTSIDANLTWPIFTGGKRIYASKIGKKLVSVAEVNREQVSANQQALLIESYFGLRLGQRVVEVKAETYNSLKTHYDQALKLEQQGMINRAERLVAQVSMEEAKRELESARKDLEVASQALKSLINIGEEQEIRTTTSLFINESIPSANYFKEMIPFNNYLVNQLKLQENIAGDQLKIGRSGYLPNIALIGKQTLYADGLDKYLMPRTMIGVGFTWNIFDGLDREKRIRQARLTSQSLAIGKEKAVSDLQVGVDKFYSQMQNAMDNVKALNTTLEMSNELVRIREKSFKEGMATSSDVVDAEVEINEPIAFNMEQEELALHGTHNLYNSLAAGISANLAGIRKEYIRKALSDFKGVEHRLEKVATVRGVSFINDSKATNVNSCWYALQSMTGKTVLILGGKDKGNDYTEIEDLVREKCSALVYLGLHNEKLHAFFDRLGLPVADVQTGMQDAVEAAFKLAKKGETVLLSPCCASFDLFKSYEDRGDQFKACVRAL